MSTFQSSFKTPTEYEADIKALKAELTTALAKLGKCREELAKCVEIIDELHAASVPVTARQTLEETK